MFFPYVNYLLFWSNGSFYTVMPIPPLHPLFPYIYFTLLSFTIFIIYFNILLLYHFFCILPYCYYIIFGILPYSQHIYIIVKDMDIDTLVITETWLTGTVSDQKYFRLLTPAGYSFRHAAQIHKKGGGGGFLFPWFSEVWNPSKVFLKLPTNFCIWGLSVRVATIYPLHPLYPKGILGICWPFCYQQWPSVYLRSFQYTSGLWAEFRWQTTGWHSTIGQSRVQEITQIHCDILDPVISREDDNLTKGVSVSSMLSDHFFININVSLQKQTVSFKVISYRRYKSIDK